jgi:UDP-glucuronate 4-epimerase
MRVLVTGNAGFIGFHTAKRLLARGDAVVGVDVVNDYYDPALKHARLAVLDEVAARSGGSYRFHHANLADRGALNVCFADGPFDRVIHLAAQAGVRYSLENPHAYVESNLVGFVNVLEACRHAGTPHLVYASTSSVYGANTRMPFSEHDGVDHPLQFYAATKRANELMAHSYSHLFQMPTTGLRFFTVYGPWGRPDMALFLFTKNIIEGRPIKLFNNGQHIRDFTYIDDLVEGVIRVSDDVAQPNPAWDGNNPDAATSSAPYRIFNIGNSMPVQLLDYVEAIEQAVGKKAVREFLPLQAGDLPDTYADVTSLVQAVNYQPRTTVDEGITRFVSWYREYTGTHPGTNW